MLFSAAPWMLAGGVAGPLVAAILAFISGLVLGAWHTHTLFTAVELAILATIFSAFVCQRYRTTTFRMLKHPLAAAIVLGFIYPFLHFLILVIDSQQELQITRLDIAFQSLPGAIIVAWIEILMGGTIAEFFGLIKPQFWTESAPRLPSPSEKSLQIRFTTNMMPLAIVLLLALIMGNWFVAGNAARNQIAERMKNTAQTAAKIVPSFLQIGQKEIAILARNPDLLSDEPIQITKNLSTGIKNIPYFTQLLLINPGGEVIANYHVNSTLDADTTIEERIAINLAFHNFLAPQFYAIPPEKGSNIARISFIAPVINSDNEVKRALVGRTNLEENPYSQPIIAILKDTSSEENIGILIDDYANILIHPNPNKIMTTFSGLTSDIPSAPGDAMVDGTRMLVYNMPVPGLEWTVITMVPAYRTQELALRIALPLLGMIIVLAFISFLILRFGLRMVTTSLNNLAQEAGRIAQGKLDQPLHVEGVDEVGQLRKAFEQMRVSLKERLDELNRLLLVSQGVASSLEVADAVQPVLEAALVSGASSARVVLAPNIVNDLSGSTTIPLSFGAGTSQNLYRDLDDQILALTRQQARLVLSNLYRPRLVNLTPGAPHPESLLAVALRHENMYYGSLWIAYDKPHNFTEEEVRFIVTLGGQAALASANSRLFMSAEIGRQQLEAILASNPDPVLVTDQREHLLLANPAAWQVLELSIEETNQGRDISEVIKNPELVELLRAINAEKQSIEVTLIGGRVFLATATSVLAEGQRVGRVCVLRDVTHFKELDDLKSDFVSTVSHDLRSPLTLMRGYATMLEMVGQLNEQQNNYIHKIIEGVDNMSRLINNLLDLGRIESGVGLQLEKVNVQELVEKVIGSLQLQATQKNIQLSYELPQTPSPTVEADHALLIQALQNLVENAVKYTKADGKVHVRVRLQPSNLLFEVIDNGIGISPVDQPRLFEKFYRGAQQTSKEMRGTGLGLAISKSIAEKHGGHIWAESQLGKGSTFYMTIPFRQGAISLEL